jgi:hypothetical protein
LEAGTLDQFLRLEATSAIVILLFAPHGVLLL